MAYPFEPELPSPGINRSIGEIIVLQNTLEVRLSDLLWQVLKLPLGTFGALYDALNNRARVDLIGRLAVASHAEDEVEEVAFALRAFDICTENRNIVAHSVFDGRLKRKYVFYKNPTTAGSSGWYFAVSAKDMARASLGARLICEHLLEVYHEIHRRGLNPPIPWPERPPLPRKLSLFRLPEDHPYGIPPPQS